MCPKPFPSKGINADGQLEMFDVPTKETAVDKALRVLGQLKHWQNEIELALALAHDSYTFDDVVTMIMVGNAILYDKGDCFAICQIIQFPQYKNLHIFIAGGNLSGILDRKEEFRSYAKEFGCRFLTCSGRPGWGRTLQREGWEHVFTTMYLEV